MTIVVINVRKKYLKETLKKRFYRKIKETFINVYYNYDYDRSK